MSSERLFGALATGKVLVCPPITKPGLIEKQMQRQRLLEFAEAIARDDLREEKKQADSPCTANSKFLKLSREEIEKQSSSKGAYTKHQLAKWGVPWPPPKGWKQALLNGRDPMTYWREATEEMLEQREFYERKSKGL